MWIGGRTLQVVRGSCPFEASDRHLRKSLSRPGDTMKTETRAIVPKGVRCSWAEVIEQLHDAYSKILNAIAGGSMALSERCSPSAMVRDE